MLRSMYGPSLTSSVGSTWNCCTISGQIPPMMNALSTMRPRLSTARRHVFWNTLTRNSTPQISATTARIDLAGSTALTSV